MEAGNNLNTEGTECVEHALNGTSALVEMISSLLDVSRLEAGQMPLNRSRCDLGVLAREAVGTLGSLVDREGVSLEMPAEPVLAFCDPDIIRRVIANLVGNAVKFTPQNGQVRVTVQKEGAKARVVVADTGPGIAPEHHEKIFEKFGQLESQGESRKHSSGLELAFCKLAVKANGGKIGVESAVGKGSRFWFVLPL